MKKPLVAFLIIFLMFGHAAVSAAGEAVVSGVLISRANNIGAPGLTVSLLHPKLGRSAPAISDSYGRFMFYGIPIMPSPYYLEVYWGTQLIYRNSVMVTTPAVGLPSILL